MSALEQFSFSDFLSTGFSGKYPKASVKVVFMLYIVCSNPVQQGWGKRKRKNQSKMMLSGDQTMKDPTRCVKEPGLYPCFLPLLPFHNEQAPQTADFQQHIRCLVQPGLQQSKHREQWNCGTRLGSWWRKRAGKRRKSKEMNEWLLEVRCSALLCSLHESVAS